MSQRVHAPDCAVALNGRHACSCGRKLTADDTAHKCEACELDADKARARAGGDVFGIEDDEREEVEE
jgi:hypothetical protein